MTVVIGIYIINASFGLKHVSFLLNNAIPMYLFDLVLITSAINI